MNKEEIKDLINDMWKDELSKSGKWALEEYIKDLQSQLDIANKKLDKIRKYLEHETLGMNNPFDKRIEELRKILSIIGGE